MLFECIIDVFAKSDIPRLTQLKTLNFGVYFHPSLSFVHNFIENVFPSFVKGLEAAENKRLIHLKHPALEQHCTRYALPLPCLYGFDPRRPVRESTIPWYEHGLPP